MVPFL
ncbi:hypothetical protein VCEM1676A_002033A, partial [Vibrio cholerae O1 str. EM-1676A]|jgi:transposase